MSLYKSVTTEDLYVRNPLFKLHEESDNTFTDTHDIGFSGQYYDGANIVYTGLFRDATDGKYKLFQSLQVEPTYDTGFVDTSGTGYTAASLVVQSLEALGDVTVAGNLTVNGTTTTVNVETLLVEDNVIVANSGPANMREDGGFVVKRIATNVDDDTKKEFGTASAAGTTTTITLQAANGHGTTLNYYTGWIIKLGGDVTGTATVTSSTAANPPVLTFDTAASGATTTSTTYELFNKRFVGMIFDESQDRITFYGFPREDQQAIFDPAGDAGNGNLADYVNVYGNSFTASGALSAGTTLSVGGNATVTGDLTVSGKYKGPILMDDNILPVNTGPTNQLEDGGFVVQRSLANVALDTVKESGTASAGGSTTTITLQAANGHGTTANYYAGWVIKFGGDVSGTSLVTSNTAANPPLLTFTPAASGATTTSTTYQLFNKRFVGSIYDESADRYILVGFPRESGEAVIDPVAPVNGNIPDYISLAVNNLTVSGSLSATIQLNLITQVGATTFTAAQIKNNQVIELNPTGGNTTYTLPQISALSLATDTVDLTTFVNIHATNQATVSRSGADTIEGTTTQNLRRQWMKMTLIAREGETTWLIQ